MENSQNEEIQSENIIESLLPKDKRKNRHQCSTLHDHGLVADLIMQDEDSKKSRADRNSAVKVQDQPAPESASSRPRRASVKPSYYQVQNIQNERKKKVGEQILEIEVGDRPEHIKPILRSKNNDKKDSKSIKFHNKCAIQVIDPIEGWKDGVVRMPEDTDNVEEEKGLRLSEQLRLTPDSCRRLQQCNPEDDKTPLAFNVYCEATDEIVEDVTESDEKNEKKSRKRPVSDNGTTAKKSKKTEDTSEKKETAPIFKVSTSKRRATLCQEKIICFTDPDVPAAEDATVDENTSSNKKKQTKSNRVVSTRKGGDSSLETSASSTTKKSSSVASTKSIKEESSIGSLSSVEEVNASGDCKKIALIELDTSCEATEDSYIDTVLQKKEISIREEFLKPSENLPTKLIAYNEIDYAPFSRFNVLPKYTNPVVDPSWVLPPKRVLTPYQPVATTNALPKFSEDVEPAESLPISNPENLTEITDKFSQDMRVWYNHALNCEEKTKALPWPQALEPTSASLWLGSSVAAEKAKAFIKYWLKRGEKELDVKPKSKKKNSYESDSDYEEDCCGEHLENPLIIVGPTGSGKSSLISALATELNCKILEVHPGEMRNGSSLRHKLSGACESQRMPSNSISSFFSKNTNTGNAPPTRQKTIIVVEDIDIHFQKFDKDFYSALKSLVAEAKVPVIWTCQKIPFEEINREPALGNFQEICLTKLDKESVFNYASVCTLALKKIYFRPKDLKRMLHRHALKHDLRGILNEIQFALVDPSLPVVFEKRKFEQIPGDLNYVPRAVYPDIQEFVRQKKIQHFPIIRDFLPDHSRPRRYNVLSVMMQSLNVHCARDVAIDYIPILVQVDRSEHIAINRNRRHMHYLSEVKGHTPAIDSDGKLRENILLFQLNEK